MEKIIFLIFVPFIAMIFEGIKRKALARMQNRIGPPIWQPVYDFFKLLKKENITAREANNIFFKISPYFYALLTFLIFLFLPYPFFKIKYDFLLLIYLFIASSFFIIIGGISSRNPFAIIGSMRETFLMLFYELAFLIATITFFIYSGAQTIGEYSLFGMIKLPIASFILISVAFIELRITPFEIPEAMSEIIAGAEIEYSGPRLAFFKLANSLKSLGILILISYLLIGTHNLISLLGLSLILLLILTFSQAVTPRYRIDQGVKFYFAIFILSLIELVRVSLWA